MNFFDFLFGKKDGEKTQKGQGPSNNNVSEKVGEYKPLQSSHQPITATAKPGNSEVSPVEQYVKESVEDLKKHTELSTKVLEAEAIYLAAFLYMKDSFQIDFKLDYLSDGLLDRIPSGNYSVADKVFSHMIKYGEDYYGTEERDFGVSGYKTNIQLTPDYGSYIKNYFIRAHKIGAGKDFTLFSSPRNCLWKKGIKIIDSPTQRDIQYKFDRNNFEFMIPPYNPLVTGRIVEKTTTTIRCESGDGRRTFVFHYDIAIKPECLNYIEMFRNDKGDMVSYHKTMEEKKDYSLNNLISGDPLHFKFKKMVCELKNKDSRFGSTFIREDPLGGTLTADVTIEKGNVVIELPKTSLINEHGGLTISDRINAKGTFVKEESDYAPLCYRMSTDEVDIRLFEKGNNVFSFICIPAISSQPKYRGYDTLFIELDLLQDNTTA